MKNPLVLTGMAAIIVLSSAIELRAGEDDKWLVPAGRGLEAAQSRRKGGESFPPLPLPATPLRRTEKKLPPAPPILIGKVQWGGSINYRDGEKIIRVHDWNMTPADVQQLLKKAQRQLNVRYRFTRVVLGAFEPDPAEVPVLYFSGARIIALREPEVVKLREYVLKGGMIWADAGTGSPYFTESFRRIMNAAFPDKEIRAVPPDHPIFRIANNIEKVAYKGVDSEQPYIEGIYFQSRLGVVISPFGMGPAWDDWEPEIKDVAVRHWTIQNGSLMGVNLVAYALAHHPVARIWSVTEEYRDENRDATDQLVFAQIKHRGVWNPDQFGPNKLLKELAQKSTLRLKYERKGVDLARDDLTNYPFLYLTGLDRPKFSKPEGNAVRAYIEKGGFILADSCLGLTSFALQLRAELKKAVPEIEFRPLPPDHDVFAANYKIVKVGYTPAVTQTHPGLATPVLEGIYLGDRLCGIFSPYELSGGWEGIDRPLARGYGHEDAVKIGINIITYAMTR